MVRALRAPRKIIRQAMRGRTRAGERPGRKPTPRICTNLRFHLLVAQVGMRLTTADSTMLAHPPRLGDPNFPPNLAIAPSCSKEPNFDGSDDGSLFSSFMSNDKVASVC